MFPLPIARLRVLIIILLLIYAGSSLLIPMGIGYDAGIGLHTWASMQSGTEWNQFRLFPNQNLELARSMFRADFSPAQYVLPGWLVMLGLPIGWASLVLVFLCSVFGLWGYARLYRSFGFSDHIVAWAVLAIACSRTVSFFFGYYLGGEPLIFAGFPWFVLIALRCLEHRFAFVLFPPLFLLGAFLKLSFVIVGIAVLAGFGFLAFSDRLAPRPLQKFFLRGIQGAILFGVSYFALHQLYLSRGWTAAQSNGVWAEPFKNVLLVVGDAPFAWASGFDLLDKIAFDHGGLRHEFTNHPAVYLSFSLVAVGSVVLLALVWQYNRNPRYRAIWAGYALVSLPLFIYLFSNAGSWYEERHLRPLSYLLLPGLAVLVDRLQPKTRLLTSAMVWLLTFSFALGSWAVNMKRRQAFAASSLTGFTQWNSDAESLTVLHALRGGCLGQKTLFASSIHTLSIEVMPHPFAVVFLPKVIGEEKAPIPGALSHLVIHRSKKDFEANSFRRFTARFSDLSQWSVWETEYSYFFHAGTEAPPQLQLAGGWKPIKEGTLSKIR